MSAKVTYDISPTIGPKTAVWPGDQPFKRDVALDMSSGDNLTLSSITTTVHIGAHVDAPNHYAKGGKTIEERSLHYYMGPCQVVTVSVENGARIERCPVEITAPRVLFRTDSFPDPNEFNTDFCALSPQLVQQLATAGVCLVGIDTPSIDLFDDKVLLSHNAIASHNMAILEGIVLTGVPDGVYNLIALPLKIAGADASPVRAVLIGE
jgi:arylformamidase